MVNLKYLAAAIVFSFLIALGFALSISLASVHFQFTLILALLVTFSFVFYKKIKKISTMIATTFLLLGIAGVLTLPLFVMGSMFKLISPNIGFGIVAIMAFIGVAFVIGIIFLIFGTSTYFLVKKKVRKKRKKK